jgi:TPR repeat protein
MGYAPSEDEALRWFKLAANHWARTGGMGAAWPRCAYSIGGVSFEHGELIAMDDLLHELQQPDLADRQLARICYNIGALYEIGQPAGFSFEAVHHAGFWVSTPDFEKSVYFYRRAASLNDARAQFALAKCLELGSGLDKNIGQALSILQHLAHLRHPQAQLKLARWHEIGHGVEVDKRLAMRLYKTAGSQIVEESLLDGDEA